MKSWWAVLIMTAVPVILGFQAPVFFDSLSHDAHHIVETFHQVADDFFSTNFTLSCSECITLLSITQKLSYLPKSVQIATLTDLCGRLKQVDKDVCAGLIREQLPVVNIVLKNMDTSGRQGHMACAAVLKACPYPAVEPWQVPFPKPKPVVQPELPLVSTQQQKKTFTILHLSDWHSDPLYEPGSEANCTKPLCCRSAFTDPDHISQPASPWGSYLCDAPFSLVESMYDAIAKVTSDTVFGLFTGDVLPHEVWSTLPVEKSLAMLQGSYSYLHDQFDKQLQHVVMPLYPAVGNHESAPVNLFPLANQSTLPDDEAQAYLNMSWLYSSLADSWLTWISAEAANEVDHNSGSYTVSPVPGLRLIVLNTNFCYNLNWWVYEQTDSHDPSGMIAWLVARLQEAEDAGERVWISGHVPPGDNSCLPDFSNYYYQVIQRYAPHVVAAQFFGHTHRDEFDLFYQSSDPSADDAISVAYIGPSITPYVNLNPGFRIYEVDAETFDIVDSRTYIANLSEAKTWNDPLEWRLEYSAKDTYGPVVASVTENPPPPLSPGWWHLVSEAMETNRTVFDTYWELRFKLSTIITPCDEECQAQTVCNIRAGKSELRCDQPPSSLFYPREKEACSIRLHA